MFKSFQGSFCGSRCSSMRTVCVPAVIVSPLSVTLPGNLPKTVSKRVRYASVSFAVMSLIATTLMSSRAASRRKTARPMRPNPLMATRGAAI
jgi:hypothetical protein